MYESTKVNERENECNHPIRNLSIQWPVDEWQVRRIGGVERGAIYERYIENGPIWDIIANDIVRHERFRNIPANVQELYANNVGNRRAARWEGFAIILQEKSIFKI